MPTVPHTEVHFSAGLAVRDVVIGMADGLTVPFALAAGLSGALSQTDLVVVAGMAEVAAGSIAMGLGGYLAGRSDLEHYESERRREEHELSHMREREENEVREIFREYGLTDKEIDPVIQAFAQKPEAWVEFMMRFELGLEKPDPSRAWRSAVTIAGAYVVGGLIPLGPYMLMDEIGPALRVSAAITLAALFVFGWIKGKFTGAGGLRSAIQTTLIGGLAATAAFGIARALG